MVAVVQTGGGPSTIGEEASVCCGEKAHLGTFKLPSRVSAAVLSATSKTGADTSIWLRSAVRPPPLRGARMPLVREGGSGSTRHRPPIGRFRRGSSSGAVVALRFLMVNPQ